MKSLGSTDLELSWVPLGQVNAGSDGPTIFTALQEQLGLQVKTDKGLADTYVILRAVRPRE